MQGPQSIVSALSSGQRPITNERGKLDRGPFHLQVEGGFMQGMGWTCIEELVWGDEQHKWVKPGTLFTRGPGLPLHEA